MNRRVRIAWIVFLAGPAAALIWSLVGVMGLAPDERSGMLLIGGLVLALATLVSGVLALVVLMIGRRWLK